MSWQIPHPLIPDDDFIQPTNDAGLLAEATDSFDFVDVLENRNFEDNIQAWLGTWLIHERVNEARPIPDSFHTRLDREFTREACALLDTLTRLEAELWALIARRRIQQVDVKALRDRTLLANTARYALLASGQS